MEQFSNGTLLKWRNSQMEQFSNRTFLKWSNSQMEQFSNGAIWGHHPMPYFKIPRAEKYGMRCARGGRMPHHSVLRPNHKQFWDWHPLWLDKGSLLDFSYCVQCFLHPHSPPLANKTSRGSLGRILTPFLSRNVTVMLWKGGDSRTDRNAN